MTGAEMIAAERRRQIDEEHWTPEHDDGHRHGELAKVAATLAVAVTDAVVVDSDGYGSGDNPWGVESKHLNPIRALTVAGALIAAEIDRLQRAAIKTLAPAAQQEGEGG